MLILALAAQGRGTRGTYRKLTLGVKDIRGVQLRGNTCMAPLCGYKNLAIGFRGVYLNQSNCPYSSFRQNWCQLQPNASIFFSAKQESYF